MIYKKKVIAGLIASTALLSACGSDSDTPQARTPDNITTVSSALGAVTLSGTVIDAIKRSAISNIEVTLYIAGATFTVTTLDSSGAYAFNKVPADSEYVLIISDPEANFAPYFYSNTTPALRDNADNAKNEAINQDIGAAELYKAEKSTINMKELNGGAGVTGLTLYYDANTIAGSNGQPVSIKIPDVIAKISEESAGVYSLYLPSNGELTKIKIKDLVDSAGNEYVPYQHEITDDQLSTLASGESINYYLKSTEQTEFTIIYHIVDEDGKALDVGNILPMYNSEAKRTDFLERKADTLNEYIQVVSAADMSAVRKIPGIDLDGDGFDDLTTAFDSDSALGLKNTISRASFDDNKELTLVYPLKNSTLSEAVQAQVISSDDNFQANGIAEIIIAFDRPVEMVHSLKMTYLELAKEQVNTSVENPASIFKADFETEVTTDQAETTLTLNSDKDYEYLDSDGVQQKIALADPEGKISSPYADKYQTELKRVELSSEQYSFGANNSLLSITLDASKLYPDQTYTFEFAVKGLLDSNPAAFMSVSKVAKSNATSTLDTLFVDNFDYKDTTTKDLLDSAAENTISGLMKHKSMFSQLNVSYSGAAANEGAQLEYLNIDNLIGDDITSLSTVDSGQNTLYLVSKAKLEGTVQIVSQTETYLDSNTNTVTTATYDSFASYYKLDMSAQAIVADDELTQLTDIAGLKTYVLMEPSNHVIQGSGLMASYGTGLTSGANAPAEGLYYLYLLPLPIPDNGGFWSDVSLNLDVSANGSALVGKKKFTVQ